MPRLYSLIVSPSESVPFVPPPEGEIWHLRQAALSSDATDKDHASLIFKTSDSATYSLGTLRRDRVDFMALDMPLTEYVEFSVKGTAAIHLTGSLIPEEEEGADFALDDEDDENMEILKAAMLNGKGPVNALTGDDEVDSENSEDEEEPGNLVHIEEITKPTNTVNKPKEKEEEEAKEKGSSIDEGLMSKSALKKIKKKQKREAERAKKEAEKTKTDSEKTEQVQKKQKLNSESLQSTPDSTNAPEWKPTSKKKKKIRRFTNGYVIECLHSVPEEGPVVTSGKKVTIKYVGRLDSGQVFDETRGDKTFTFKYGTGQVISGLDKGLDDMRVGEKRRLTVPPKMGYGAAGAEPAVPPNAELSFDIELLKIST